MSRFLQVLGLWKGDEHQPPGICSYEYSILLLRCDVAVAGTNVVNGGNTPQVLSPMAVTTFQVNPNNGQPTIIDPSLISQYSGKHTHSTQYLLNTLVAKWLNS